MSLLEGCEGPVFGCIGRTGEALKKAFGLREHPGSERKDGKLDFCLWNSIQAVSENKKEILGNGIFADLAARRTEYSAGDLCIVRYAKRVNIFFPLKY